MLDSNSGSKDSDQQERNDDQCASHDLIVVSIGDVSIGGSRRKPEWKEGRVPDVGIEKALWEAFIAPGKRRRYLELLDTKRGRDKIRFGLDHLGDLDPSLCKKIKPGEQHFQWILEALQKLGAPSNCYVISSADALDGRHMSLVDALQEVIGHSTGTFVSCIVGELAYFESEDINERYICHRKKLE